MSEASTGRWETNLPPRRERRAVQGSSQASPLTDRLSVGRSDTSSHGSTQKTLAATETNTEPIRRASPDRTTRFLSLEASWENTGAHSSSEAAGLVCMPLPLAPVSDSIGFSQQGVRSGNWRDNSRETPMLSTAADPVRPVSPPPLSYLVSQRLGDGGTAHHENSRSPLSPPPITAPTCVKFEDFIETDHFEGPWSDREMTDIGVRPALPGGAETRNLPSPPQELCPEALEALDLIFNVNPGLPFGFGGEGFFPALASTVPLPPALAFYPLGSPSRFSAAREMGAIHPLPINPATDTPQPAALPIDPQVTLALPLAFEESYRPQQDPPPPGCHENLVAVAKDLYYSSRSPVPRFRTMSDNPWVVAAGDTLINNGVSMAGGPSTIVGDQNFGSPSLNGTEYMGTDGIEGVFIPISAITRPGFSDETLLGHSGTDRMQELAGSAYRAPEPLMSSCTNTRYSSVYEPYLDTAIDPHHRRLSRASTASLSHHSYPINPLRIGEPLVSNIPPPPMIDVRATYSSYPPLPLPPREQTYRPWSMNVSEDGTQFISLGDCDLSGHSQGSEDAAGSGAWIGGPGGRSNAVGGRGSRIGGSKSGTRFGW